MFNHSFGQEVFLKAIQNYLLHNKYDNAKPEFLEAEFESLISKPLKFNVSTIIDSWINQAGYPVVNITVNGDEVTFSQVS